ncbi:hypothetical protein KVT40_003346 [Elsinoe batatas]|uniref:Uncharacterized protein n=1 Tax=Elsinoe batatas TaxID=2601811 RepID=A0A8K0L836_9PEZI|nr:hypothetical protein KVT40_003346 [Elsinoe batatas]
MKLLHMRRDRTTSCMSVASAMPGSDDEWSKIYPAVPLVSSPGFYAQQDTDLLGHKKHAIYSIGLPK